MQFVMKREWDMNEVAKPENPHIANLFRKIADKAYEKFDCARSGFWAFDLNANGSLSFKEFFQGIQLIGVNTFDHECKEVFKFLDKDGDGWLSLKEFSVLFDQVKVKKDDIQRSEALYLQNPTEYSMKLNQMQLKEISNRGKRGSQGSMFGVANTG